MAEGFDIDLIIFETQNNPLSLPLPPEARHLLLLLQLMLEVVVGSSLLLLLLLPGSLLGHHHVLLLLGAPAHHGLVGEHGRPGLSCQWWRLRRDVIRVVTVQHHLGI